MEEVHHSLAPTTPMAPQQEGSQRQAISARQLLAAEREAVAAEPEAEVAAAQGAAEREAAVAAEAEVAAAQVAAVTTSDNPSPPRLQMVNTRADSQPDLAEEAKEKAPAWGTKINH